MSIGHLEKLAKKINITKFQKVEFLKKKKQKVEFFFCVIVIHIYYF